MAEHLESTVDQLYRWVWQTWRNARLGGPDPGDPPDHILRAGADLCEATTHERFVAGWIDRATHLDTCDCHPAKIARWRRQVHAQAVESPGDTAE